MATTPRTLRSDEQACNDCGAVFRVRKAGARNSTYGAKGVSVREDEIDPMNPLCPKCRKPTPGLDAVDTAIAEGVYESTRARQTGATVEQLEAEQAEAEEQAEREMLQAEDAEKGVCTCLVYVKSGDERDRCPRPNHMAIRPSFAPGSPEAKQLVKDAGMSARSKRVEEHRMAAMTDDTRESLGYGTPSQAHHRVDRGRCYCGKFCHTFGKGDDRKLAFHITRANNDAKAQTRTWIVRAQAVEVVHVEATSKEEAIAKVKARDFEGEAVPTVSFTARPS